MTSARRPCFRAFWRERALPSGVFGPVDFWAFWRLISLRLESAMGGTLIKRSETCCFSTPHYRVPARFRSANRESVEWGEVRPSRAGPAESRHSRPYGETLNREPI